MFRTPWRGLLLLFCLLAAAGCAAGPAATSTPTLAHRAVPTFTSTPAPPFTPSAQVAGVYANLEVHPGGSYRLQRRGDLVEADLVSTSSAVQFAAQQQPQVLFTVPPVRIRARSACRLTRTAACATWTTPTWRSWATLAYRLHLTWGTTAVANDQAVLQLLRTTMGGPWLTRVSRTTVQ